jgi:hypothetical protein
LEWLLYEVLTEANGFAQSLLTELQTDVMANFEV